MTHLDPRALAAAEKYERSSNCGDLSPGRFTYEAFLAGVAWARDAAGPPESPAMPERCERGHEKDAGYPCPECAKMPEGEVPGVWWAYLGEELALLWTNPWDGKEEKIATFWWPGHPPEKTEAVEAMFETFAARACVSGAPLTESPAPPASPPPEGGKKESERYGWNDIRESDEGIEWVMREEAESLFEAFIGGQDERCAELESKITEAKQQGRALDMVKRAAKLLAEGKAKFAPHTTNSFVDDWLKDFADLEIESRPTPSKGDA